MALYYFNRVPEFIFEELKEKVKNGMTYREAAYWLQKETGYVFSHVTIMHYVTGAKEYKPDTRYTETKKWTQRKTERVLQSKIGAETTKKLHQEANKVKRSTSNKVIDQDLAKKTVHDDKKIAFMPNEGPQTDFLSSPEDDVLYGGAAGGGKAQPLSALVYTPSGFKPMGSILVGDIVSTPDGGETRVKQIHPQGVQDIYLITFQDGSSVETTAEHLWEYTIAGDGNRSSSKLITTVELQDYLYRQYGKKRPRWPLIPLTEPIEKKKQDLPIDPYVLGCIIGDGSTVWNRCGFTSADEEIIQEIRKRGYDINSVSGQYQFSIKGINTPLRDLGLMGKRSWEKSIPPVYKESNIADRLSLIQGLMDTDGYVTKGKYYFTTTSEQLSDDVAEIIRSLGGTATKTFKTPAYKIGNESYVGRLAYTLYIRYKDGASLFNLKRKKSQCKYKPYLKNRVISVSLSHREEAKCITLEDSRGLYLTNNYIVTHNSVALVVDPLRYCHRPKHRGLILRRTLKELRQLIDLSREYYSIAFPNAKYKESEKLWVFQSGAKIEFNYLEKDADVYQYQGQDFTYIAFDEITQLPTEFPWQYLQSRLRTTDPEIECYMRASANPGGPGHGWVKARYIDPSEPNQPFMGRDGLTRRFIPAKLKDNPHLFADGRYMRMLESLPEVQRKQLLEGNWEVSEGMAFPEFDREVHVIEPFKIPSSWQRLKGVDYGYASPSAVIWGAVDPSDGTLIIYRELYKKGLTGETLGQYIIDAEMEETRDIPGVIDWAVFSRTGYTGPTIGETLNRSPFNLKLRMADKNRKAGLVQLHERLRIQSNGRPKMQIFSNCTNLLRELTSLTVDKTDPEDVDTRLDDHAYDALRYMCMSRPIQDTFYNRMYQFKRERQYIADPVFGY